MPNLGKNVKVAANGRGHVTLTKCLNNQIVDFCHWNSSGQRPGEREFVGKKIEWNSRRTWCGFPSTGRKIVIRQVVESGHFVLPPPPTHTNFALRKTSGRWIWMSCSRSLFMKPFNLWRRVRNGFKCLPPSAEYCTAWGWRLLKS